jgi:hypothetical protein
MYVLDESMGRELTLDSIQRAFCVLWVQVSYRLTHDKPKLNLIVQIHAARPQDGSRTRQEDGRRRLEEEKWLLGCFVVEFFDMVAGVVSLGTCVGEEGPYA